MNQVFELTPDGVTALNRYIDKRAIAMASVMTDAQIRQWWEDARSDAVDVVYQIMVNGRRVVEECEAI